MEPVSNTNKLEAAEAKRSAGAGAYSPLPCPFCGAVAVVRNFHESGGGSIDTCDNDYPWAVECDNVNCTANMGYFATRDAVVGAWNSRTQSNLERDLRKSATHALGVLQLFDYVSPDEDTGAAEFTGSVNLDWFFHVKWELEKILSEGNTEPNTKDRAPTDRH